MQPTAPFEEKDRTRDEEFRAFLVKDYELKIAYLTDHFSRIWLRFNFFVTIEAALLGSKFLIGNGNIMPHIAGLGAGLSLVWYWFGAEDRYLVLIYRQQVRDAGKRVGVGKSYGYVGQVEDLGAYPPKGLLEWRISFMNTTRLAALFPLLTFFAWLGTFALLLVRK